MKNKYLLLFLFAIIKINAQVGINESAPNGILDIKSTNSGLLIPRIALLSNADAVTVTNPQGGALKTSTLIYNTSNSGTIPNNIVEGFYYWNGTIWVGISNSKDWNILGNSDTNSPIIPAIYATSLIATTENFIGTKSNNDVVIGTSNIERIRIKNSGQIGIGTANPTSAFHVSGQVKIVDGTQGAGKVLTSDANGLTSWQLRGISNILGNLTSGGISIPNTNASFLQTGSFIVLPVGKYAVNVNMLVTTNSPTPNNSSIWLRSTFSNSNATNPSPTADIVGNTLASGNLPGTSNYAMLNGTIVINNTSGGNKTYYYVAGQSQGINTSQNLLNFGGYWAEDNIVAYRLD